MRRCARVATFDREYRLLSAARVWLLYPLSAVALTLLGCLGLACVLPSAEVRCTHVNASGGREECVLAYGTLVDWQYRTFAPGTEAQVDADGSLVIGTFRLKLFLVQMDAIAEVISARRRMFVTARSAQSGFSISDFCPLAPIAIVAALIHGLVFGGTLKVRADDRSVTFRRTRAKLGGGAHVVALGTGAAPKLHVRGRTLFVEGAGVVVRRASAGELRRLVADLAAFYADRAVHPPA